MSQKCSEKEICSKNGIIALLGYHARPPKVKEYNYQTYDLIYIDMNGEPVLLNQKEVLDALTFHKEKERFVPDAIDKGEEKAIQLKIFPGNMLEFTKIILLLQTIRLATLLIRSAHPGRFSFFMGYEV